MTIERAGIQLAAVRSDLIQTLAIFKEINPEFDPEQPITIPNQFGQGRVYRSFYEIPIWSGMGGLKSDYGLAQEVLSHLVLESSKILFKPFDPDVSRSPQTNYAVRIDVPAFKMANLEYAYASGFRQTNLFAPLYHPQLHEYFTKHFNSRDYGISAVGSRDTSRYRIVVSVLPAADRQTEATTFAALSLLRGWLNYLSSLGSEADYQARLKRAFGEAI